MHAPSALASTADGSTFAVALPDALTASTSSVGAAATLSLCLSTQSLIAPMCGPSLRVICAMISLSVVGIFLSSTGGLGLPDPLPPPPASVISDPDPGAPTDPDPATDPAPVPVPVPDPGSGTTTSVDPDPDPSCFT